MAQVPASTPVSLRLPPATRPAPYPQLSRAQGSAPLRYATTYPGDIAERIALAEATEAVPTLRAS
jgi:hypothetical protein